MEKIKFLRLATGMAFLGVALSVQAVIRYLPVAGQLGLTCGAHAVKNAFALANPHHSNLLYQSIDAEALLETLNGHQVQQQIFQERNNRYRERNNRRLARPRQWTIRRDVNNLSAEEVITLTGYAYGQADAITVLDDLGHSPVVFDNFYGNKLVHARRNLSRDGGQYVFILGSAQAVLEEGEFVPRDGHWIAVQVTRTRAGFNYDVADSIKGARQIVVINQLDAILRRHVLRQQECHQNHPTRNEHQVRDKQTLSQWLVARYATLKKRTCDFFATLQQQLNTAVWGEQPKAPADTSSDALLAQHMQEEMRGLPAPRRRPVQKRTADPTASDACIARALAD